jgi:hypothetical protein
LHAPVFLSDALVDVCASAHFGRPRIMDFQKLIFDWVSGQHGLTGAFILVAGLLYGFCGARMYRYLVVLPSAGLGALAGAIAAALAGVDALLAAAGAGVVAGILGMAYPRFAAILTGGASWALLGGYIVLQAGGSEFAAFVALCVVGGIGTVLTILSRQPMTIVATTLQGAAMMVIGFVGLSHAILPSLSSTFCTLANSQGLTVPVLMAMLSAMCYSYQASEQQGDIFTGGSRKPPV